MSAFAGYEHLVSDAVDGIFGETVIITPRVPGGYTKSALDDSRESRSLTAVVDFNPIVAEVKTKGQYDGYQAEVAGDRIHVSISETELGPKDTWPVQSDLLALPERPGTPSLRVVTAQPDGLGRVVFICSRA